MFAALRRWRRRRTADRMQVSPERWQQVEASLPFLDYLPPDERPRLRRLALEFLADKQIHGAEGLVLGDDILLSIALQACLPVLHIGLDAYADWVGIVVYPGDFVIPRSFADDDGVVHEYDDEVLGEAWEGGPVLLSWFEPGDALEGVNVVIHEFAHKLDMGNGEVDGYPVLPAHMPAAEWAGAFKPAYEDLCARVDRDEDTGFDPYATENPGEFFAVMSEAFFETPGLLKTGYPAVYDQLARYYGQDPAARARTAQEAHTEDAKLSL
ncbi:M90 family metallopeptidase [Zoogloea dura]|jgi:Mlc titration factor MtfA (ptsG expression regulator)|uniref:Zinc-dependent peptidase n=1 Tax=Zoogloea dura TaxID=2728840 RepID=A0A848G0L1_9RHOO|nr:M90 family metallopeptidase [Zoogloea dura]NML24659.1 zinc-dependent peptidase [Zoogloea dura]